MMSLRVVASPADPGSAADRRVQWHMTIEPGPRRPEARGGQHATQPSPPRLPASAARKGTAVQNPLARKVIPRSSREVGGHPAHQEMPADVDRRPRRTPEPRIAAAGDRARGFSHRSSPRIQRSGSTRATSKIPNIKQAMPHQTPQSPNKEREPSGDRGRKKRRRMRLRPMNGRLAEAAGPASSSKAAFLGRGQQAAMRRR